MSSSEHVDAVGKKISPGDFVCYAATVGQSPTLRLAIVVDLSARKTRDKWLDSARPPEKTLKLLALVSPRLSAVFDKLITVGLSTHVLLVDENVVGAAAAQALRDAWRNHAAKR